ncbi:hypothetical protein HCJ76_44085 [Streptomyces sp. MC1]|uniref:hypothetical protein n=1 Tax=Streptomyces sp. MC1 TaxID=295105 RepID=UPI0018C929B6|nr:hypothetical protein [Streptomyces sp. MC1]MBG7704864.1 hypothetical protein [Streptomyces sp. MC1]
MTITATAPQTAGDILLAALADYGIPFHVVHIPMWGSVVEIRLTEVGAGTGTLEIADRDASILHPANEHTGWSLFRKDANGEFVPATCEPMYIGGDGYKHYNCANDSQRAAEAIADFLTAPATPTAGDLMIAALAKHGIRALEDEVSIAVPMDQSMDLDDTLWHDRIVIADRNPWYGHAPQEHTGWVVDVYNPDNEPVSDEPPIHIAGDNKGSLVDCAADCAAAAAAIAAFLTK